MILNCFVYNIWEYGSRYIFYFGRKKGEAELFLIFVYLRLFQYFRYNNNNKNDYSLFIQLQFNRVLYHDVPCFVYHNINSLVVRLALLFKQLFVHLHFYFFVVGTKRKLSSSRENSKLNNYTLNNYKFWNEYRWSIDKYLL